MAPNSRKRTQVSLRTKGIDRTLSISRRLDASNFQRNALRDHFAARCRQINSSVEKISFNHSSLFEVVLSLKTADNLDPISTFRIICEQLSDFSSILPDELVNNIMDIIVSIVHKQRFVEYADRLDSEILWIAANLTYRSERIRIKVLEFLGPLLLEVLSGTDDGLKELSLWCIGNIASDGLECHSALVTNAILPQLSNIFRSTNLSLVRLSAWCLGNILQDPFLLRQEYEDMFHMSCAWISFVVYTELQQCGLSHTSFTTSLTEIQSWLLSYQEEWKRFLPFGIESLIGSHWHMDPEKCAFLPLASEFLYVLTRLFSQQASESMDLPVSLHASHQRFIVLIAKTIQVFWHCKPLSPRSSLTFGASHALLSDMHPVQSNLYQQQQLVVPSSGLSIRAPQQPFASDSVFSSPFIPIASAAAPTSALTDPTPGLTPFPQSMHDTTPATGSNPRQFDPADFANASITQFCLAMAQLTSQSSNITPPPSVASSSTLNTPRSTSAASIPGWMDSFRHNTQSFPPPATSATTASTPNLAPPLPTRALVLAPRAVELLHAVATRVPQLRTTICETTPILSFLGSVLRGALCHAWQKPVSVTPCFITSTACGISGSNGSSVISQGEQAIDRDLSTTDSHAPPLSSFPTLSSLTTLNAPSSPTKPIAHSFLSSDFTSCVTTSTSVANNTSCYPTHVDAVLAHQTIELLRTIIKDSPLNALHILGAECPTPPPLPSFIQESLSPRSSSDSSPISPRSRHHQNQTHHPATASSPTPHIPSPFASLTAIAHLTTTAFVPLGLLPLLVSCLHLPFSVFSSALDCLHTLATVPCPPSQGLHSPIAHSVPVPIEEEHYYPFVGILLAQPHLVPSLFKAFTFPDPRTQRTSLALVAHIMHSWCPLSVSPGNSTVSGGLPDAAPASSPRTGRADLTQYRSHFPNKSNLWFSSLHSIGPAAPGVTYLAERGLTSALTHLLMEVNTAHDSGRGIYALAETLLEYVRQTQDPEAEGYGNIADFTDTMLNRNEVHDTAPQTHFANQRIISEADEMDKDAIFTFEIDTGPLNITNSFEIFFAEEQCNFTLENEHNRQCYVKNGCI